LVQLPVRRGAVRLFPELHIFWSTESRTITNGLGKGTASSRAAAPERDDVRIDLTEALAAEALGDFKLEQQAAGRAAQKGLVLGAQLVLAEARAREGWAAERLGEPDKAAAALAEAERLYSQGGDRHGAAAARHMFGDALYDHGDFAGARQNYQQALAVYRQIGAQRTGKCRDGLGAARQCQESLRADTRHRPRDQSQKHRCRGTR